MRLGKIWFRHIPILPQESDQKSLRLSRAKSSDENFRGIRTPAPGEKQDERICNCLEGTICRRKSLAEAQVAAQFRFRILVVDDEPLIRETARMILEGKGYEVLTAADGREGLHSLGKSLPDLIISDLNMPRMTGSEFLAVVRLRFPHIATIATSGGYSSG